MFVGELLSGASYITTACLFMKHVTMSHGTSAGTPLTRDCLPPSACKDSCRPINDAFALLALCHREL